ncbi:MAG: hypothetical protein IKG42_01145 [Clostridia bacterium]|nr:hypothetical protein [Clostridia bacterium]
MKELKIKINDQGIEYLEKVVETGKNFQLHEFNLLSKCEKDSLFASMFSEILRKLMAKSVGDDEKIKVSKGKNGEIIVQKKVLVYLLGEKKGNKYMAKNTVISINSYPTAVRIIISKFVFKKNELICNVDVDEANLTERSIIKAVPNSALEFFKNPSKVKYEVYYEDLNYMMKLKKSDITELFVDKFKEIFEQMNLPRSKSKWLGMFFDKLHSEGLTYMFGEDAVNLSMIYANLNKHYPLYESLSMNQKLDILEEGYKKARVLYKAECNTDLYKMARCIFEVLVEKDMVNRVRISSVDYTLLEKYTEDIFREGKLVKKDFLRWLRFEYYSNNKHQLTTGYQASDLWALLCKISLFDWL